MIEVYFYLPSSEIDDVIECGLKLSRWYDREVPMEGDMRKCLAALLNPRDEIDKYDSGQYACAKMQVQPDACFIAERHYYILGADSPVFMQMYLSSICPVQEYLFGSYRYPECLVMTTVLSEHLAKLDKRRDSPVLYNNSEELFLNNLLQSLEENDKESKDSVLYCYYDALAKSDSGGIIKRAGDVFDVFIDEKNMRAYPLRRPEWFGKNPDRTNDE